MLPISVPSRIVRTSLTVPVYGMRLIQEKVFKVNHEHSAETSTAVVEPEFHPRKVHQEEDDTDGIVYTFVHFSFESIHSILSYLWHLPLVESLRTHVRISEYVDI